MQVAPIPPDEETRLALLRACKIMYTPAEEAFDDVARLAAEICGSEIALITLVDSEQQWFKARVGVAQTETARDLSFCGHCITHKNPMVVPDTHLDPRFADNPLVTGDPFLRFYAGVPLLIGEGSSVGALSVADRSPRSITPRQLDSLTRLAAQVSRELRLRRDLDQVSMAAVASSELLVAPGSVIDGRFRIEREIGRGGVGAVFEARNQTGDRVAIKVLLPEWRNQDAVLERFAREARVLMRLATPYVGKLLDVGNLAIEQGDLPYLVLEYLEGRDLESILVESGRLAIHTAFAWCADACEGVAEAHDLGVVHRDIKPSNIFLADGDGAPTVKVLDFGIAAGEPTAERPVGLTRAGGLLGTPAYMSPEQMLASSEVDPRSDIWSMGVLLYQMIAGRLPFRGKSDLEVFSAAMTRPPLPLRPQLEGEAPPDVDQIVFKCLRKNRDERFQSMRVLAESLRAVALGA